MLIIPGMLLFGLGVIQLLPVMKRRAAESGFSKSSLMPLIFIGLGFVFVLINLLVL